jgi:hypothetical protein
MESELLLVLKVHAQSLALTDNLYPLLQKHIVCLNLGYLDNVGLNVMCLIVPKNRVLKGVFGHKEEGISSKIITFA